MTFWMLATATLGPRGLAPSNRRRHSPRGPPGGPVKVTLRWTLIRTCLPGDGFSGQNPAIFGPRSALVLEINYGENDSS